MKDCCNTFESIVNCVYLSEVIEFQVLLRNHCNYTTLFCFTLCKYK